MRRLLGANSLRKAAREEYFNMFQFSETFLSSMHLCKEIIKFLAGCNKEIEVLRSHISLKWTPEMRRDKKKRRLLESPPSTYRKIAFTVDYTTSIIKHDSIWGCFKSIKNCLLDDEGQGVTQHTLGNHNVPWKRLWPTYANFNITVLPQLTSRESCNLISDIPPTVIFHRRRHQKYM